MYPNQFNPQQPPAQPQAPQGYAPQPPQGGGNIYAAAEHNMLSSFINEPVKTGAARQRIDDGTHHIYIDSAQLTPSKKDNRVFLLWTFTVVDSTVEAAKQQQYTYPMFFGNRYQAKDLTDVVRTIWGDEQYASWVNQGCDLSGFCHILGQYCAGKYAQLVTRRNMKNGETYDQAFINHLFRNFTEDKTQLPPLPQMAAPHIQASQPSQPQGFQPQGFPMPQPQQAAPPQSQPQGFQPPQPQPQGFQPPQPQQAAPPQPQGFPPAGGGANTPRHFEE